jgi:phosphotransferase system enzyme I (PtsI)
MPTVRKKKSRAPEALTVKGLGVSSGIAIGPPFILRAALYVPPHRKLTTTEEIEQEVARFHRALEITREQLHQTIQEAKADYGKEYSAILESHFLILEDVEMIRATLKHIQNSHLDAESALSAVMDKFKHSFLKSNNEYLRERATDIEDVKRRLLGNLSGQQRSFVVEEPSIIVADTIRPSDIAGIDRSRILGFLSEAGGALSHFAIVARSLNIPAVVGIANVTGFIGDHDNLLVDGHSGDVIINPDDRAVREYRRRAEVSRREAAELEPLAELTCETRDRHAVLLTANVELAEEVEAALRYGARGIGLYRTEYMLFSERELPTEEQQYREYLTIAEKVHPYKITMRTFDVGGDKIPLDILASRGYVREDNPFLGWRAIRIALECPEFFMPQVRAILRLSATHPVEIMLPMIVSVDEVRALKRMIDEARRQLSDERQAFNPSIPVGIMIETPGAALMADTLARETDFFSIGTNDLVQYTLAADRGNPKVASLYSCFHPGVLQLIRQTIDAAKRHKIHVAMCGEMASNPYATVLLLGMGLMEFSALPPRLPKLKKLIRGVDFSYARKLAEQILAMDDLKEIEQTVTRETRRLLGNITDA